MLSLVCYLLLVIDICCLGKVVLELTQELDNVVGDALWWKGAVDYWLDENVLIGPSVVGKLLNWFEHFKDWIIMIDINKKKI